MVEINTAMLSSNDTLIAYIKPPFTLTHTLGVHHIESHTQIKIPRPPCLDKHEMSLLCIQISTALVYI